MVPLGSLVPLAAGALAMACVGGSAAVGTVLVDAPLCTVQAVRYAVACVLLVGLARARGVRVVAPRGVEWLWLLGIAAAGLVLFNIALVRGAEHAEPAVLGVAVACVPLLLAALGPLLEGHGPSRTVLGAAGVVTCGAWLVQGLGRSDAVGLGWAGVVLGGEAAFTLLAVPVLARHGPFGVSVHTTWIAAVIFAAVAGPTDGPTAVTRVRADQVLAGGYLAVVVTTLAFLCWYTSVRRLGAARAGLLAGVAPVAAAIAGVAMGGPIPRPLVWVGIGTVAAGLAIGLPATGRPASGRKCDHGDGCSRPERSGVSRMRRSMCDMLGVHFAVTVEQEHRLLAAGGNGDADALGELLEGIEECWDDLRACTDKAWDALHRCLSDGTLDPEKGAYPLSFAVLGGRHLHDEYYVVHVAATEVKAVAGALRGVDRAWLRQRFEAMDPAGYTGARDDADFEYTWQNFIDMRAFYDRAAASGRAVIFTAT